MKKSLAIIMSLSLVATAAFAQDAAVATTAAKTVVAPVATYGFKADFEARVAKDNASDTFEQGKVNTPSASFNPFGLKATKFAVNPFVNLDWSKMSVKAEAAYNAFDANLDDYSKIALTTTWKDFYGVEIKSEVAADNKGDKDATVKTATTEAGNVTLGNLSNDITATYANKDSGVTLYTKYDAAKVFGLLNFGGQAKTATDDGAATTGENLKAMFDGFAEMGLALDTADFGAKVVYKQGQTVFAPTDAILDAAYTAAYNAELALANAAGDIVNSGARATAKGNAAKDALSIKANRFDTAWFEARKMFGGWTARFNDSAEMALRIKDLDSDVTIGRSGYGIGKGNNVLGGIKTSDDLNGAKVLADGVTKVTVKGDIVWLRDMNMLNTISVGKNLTVKTGLILPTQADVAMVDWLKGQNMSIGAEYALENIGTIGVGALVSKDYVANGDGSHQGPSLVLTNMAVNGPGLAAAAMVNTHTILNNDSTVRAAASTAAATAAALPETTTAANAAFAAVLGAGGSVAEATAAATLVYTTAAVNAYTPIANTNVLTKAAHKAGLAAGAFGSAAYSAAVTAATTAGGSAYAAQYVAFGPAIWLDANLSKMVGKDNSLFVSLDGNIGSYTKTTDTLAAWAAQAATKPYTIEMGTMSKWALGAEAGFKVTEAFKFSAAAMYKIGLGYDAKNAAGRIDTYDAEYKALKATKTQFVSDNFTEANMLNYYTYDIKPLTVNVRADYTMNKTAAVYLKNGFILNAGDLNLGEKRDDSSDDISVMKDATAGSATFGVPVACKDMNGYYSKNTITLGATLVATPKSKLTISGDYNLYLGVPEASDLYLNDAAATGDPVVDAANDAAEAAAKKHLDASYATWKSSNFNPFSVKVAYSYAY